MPHSTFQVILSASTDVGTVRKNNEDTFALFSLEDKKPLRPGGSQTHSKGKGLLLLVCDGMGGANAGEIASQIAINKTLEHITKHCPESPSQTPDATLKIISDALSHAHDAVLNTSLKHDEQKGMGSTITLFWIANDKGWLGQVGDSRLYKLTTDTIEQLSDDQTPVWELLKEGLIDEEEARCHPKRNLLHQALGAGLSQIEPDCRTVEINDQDIFLLCSDGLSDALTNQSIHQIIFDEAKLSLPTACQYLTQAANHDYGQDNVTISLCQLKTQTVE